MEYFEISEVTELTKLSQYTLRYYEKIGLIKDIKEIQ
ncbi:MAG: MerR family DNA-binding transcriptional regulator [Clostridiaceae bacterium]